MCLTTAAIVVPEGQGYGLRLAIDRDVVSGLQTVLLHSEGPHEWHHEFRDFRSIVVRPLAAHRMAKGALAICVLCKNGPHEAGRNRVRLFPKPQRALFCLTPRLDKDSTGESPSSDLRNHPILLTSNGKLMRCAILVSTTAANDGADLKSRSVLAFATITIDCLQRHFL